MDRESFNRLMCGEVKAESDYEIYLNTNQIFRCQKNFKEIVNHDEMQFQIVHQIEEMWMKIIGHSLFEIMELMEQGHTNRIATLFARIHRIQQLMIEQLKLLETMSPFDYQAIREGLGNGSGQESPGFRSILAIAPQLWQAFEDHMCEKRGVNVEDIYAKQYSHCGTYVVAEGMAEFDSNFQAFLFHHLRLIARSIGSNSKSLKGRTMNHLQTRLAKSLFPKLWEVRDKMTDEWGKTYGVVRESLAATKGK